MRIECDDCGYLQVPAKRDILATHWLSLHSAPAVQAAARETCDVCGSTLGNRRLLKLHMQIRHTAASFHCDDCDYGCNVRGSLFGHVTIRHGQVGLASLAAQHRVARNLAHHSRLEKSADVVCDFCGHRSKRASNLAKHVIIHFVHKTRWSVLKQPNHKVECNGCGRDFTRKSSLFQHFLTKHTDNETRDFWKTKLFTIKHSLIRCDACLVLVRRHNLFAHHARLHADSTHPGWEDERLRIKDEYRAHRRSK